MLKLGEGVLHDDFDHMIVMEKPEDFEPTLWKSILNKGRTMGYAIPANLEIPFQMSKSALINILNAMAKEDFGLMTLKGLKIELSPLTVYLKITQLQMPPENDEPSEDKIRKFPGLK